MANIIRHIYKSIVMALVNTLLSGTFRPFFPIKRRLLRSVGYQIGKGTKVVGPIFCTAQLNIGENCWIGTNLRVHGNGAVSLGDNLDLGPDITILTGSHLIGDCKRRAGKGIICNINIGDGCWIGAKSTILNPVTIGNGCVVAAGAVVCKNLKDNVLAGGVPARVIRALSGTNQLDMPIQDHKTNNN